VYRIEGTLIGAKDGDVVTMSRGRRSETATIENEKFVFNFNLEHPDLVSLLPPGGGMQLRMFVQPGTVKLTAELGTVELDRRFAEAAQTTSRTSNTFTNVVFEGDAIKDWNFFVNYSRGDQETSRTRNREALIETIRAHPDSPLSGFLLNTHLSAQTDYDIARELFEGLSEKGKSSHHAMLFRTTMEAQGRLAESRGQKAHDFALVDREGETISLSDYKGKYVVLSFWGSWCGPCRRSHPHWIAQYEKYKDKNFDILGLAQERSTVEVWLQAIEDDNLPWRQVNLATNDEAGRAMLSDYNVRAFPTKILINPDGEIIVFGVGSSTEIDEKLKEIFGM
jgi:peroxiredoxin